MGVARLYKASSTRRPRLVVLDDVCRRLVLIPVIEDHGVKEKVKDDGIV
jgi:hypothetical protein